MVGIAGSVVGEISLTLESPADGGYCWVCGG